MERLQQAVVIAGGAGRRLGELTRDVPKPMVDIGGKPFLERIVQRLTNAGIHRIVLSIGHLGHVIRDHFGDGVGFDAEISYVNEEAPAGTGGFLVLGRELLEPSFLALNGDTMFHVDHHALFRILIESNAEMAIAMRRVDDATRYGSIVCEDNVVLRVDEKQCTGPGLINGGMYVMRRSVADYVQQVPCSIETELLPALVAKGKLVGMESDGLFVDIGIPESLAEARSLLGGSG